MANALYYGDNLDVLRESIKDGSIDLIYLDPPFNSNASYNVLFKAPNSHRPRLKRLRILGTGMNMQNAPSMR